MKLYRFQDAEGRGPWRPGFSHRWIDPDKDDSECPPMMQEFPRWQRAVRAARHLPYIGCCVIGEAGIRRWFTDDEIQRLLAFGFRLVDASALTPICVGAAQVIAGSRFPLCYLPYSDEIVSARHPLLIRRQ